MESIPTLAIDLHTITQLNCEIGKSKGKSEEDKDEEKDNRYKNHHMCNVDLNSLPYGLSENDESDQSATGLISLNTLFCGLTTYVLCMLLKVSYN